MRWGWYAKEKIPSFVFSLFQNASEIEKKENKLFQVNLIFLFPLHPNIRERTFSLLPVMMMMAHQLEQQAPLSLISQHAIRINSLLAHIIFLLLLQHDVTVFRITDDDACVCVRSHEKVLALVIFGLPHNQESFGRSRRWHSLLSLTRQQEFFVLLLLLSLFHRLLFDAWVIAFNDVASFFESLFLSSICFKVLKTR